MPHWPCCRRSRRSRRSAARRVALRWSRPMPIATRPWPIRSRTSSIMSPVSSRSRNGATIRGSRSAVRACRAISICAASSSTWTAFRSTPPMATAISRRSTRPPTNMSRSTRAAMRCNSAPIRSAARSILSPRPGVIRIRTARRSTSAPSTRGGSRSMPAARTGRGMASSRRPRRPRTASAIIASARATSSVPMSVTRSHPTSRPGST